MTYNVIQGNSAEVLKQYPDNYFDSVVCDPPYGINFLGKDWDSNTGEEEVYRQCYRVLKPGGHLLAFSAARTYHHLAMSVERSGFEIRDQIMWVYGSGFPKSQDVGRQIQKSLGVKETKRIKTHDLRSNALMDGKGQAELDQVIATDPEAKRWSGWGNALKPSHEPIVVAQKPMKQALYKNVQEWGVGALNIDACRVGDSESIGRFPANLIHDGSQEVVELFPDSNGAGGSIPDTKVSGYGEFSGRGKSTYTPNNRTPVDSGSGSAARFFYCAKVSRGERNIGCEDVEPTYKEAANFRPNHMEKAQNGEDGNPFGRYKPIQNNHPTVKPVDLMRYLIKLVTPSNSRVLDPFCGSGSTGMAAVELGHEFVGIELDPRYCDIARRRIQGWIDQLDPITRSPLFGERNV